MRGFGVIIEGMINIQNEGLNIDVWDDKDEHMEKTHSSDENTEGLSLGQTKELLIKDIQILLEKTRNKKFEFELDGEPEDELGKTTYKNKVAQFELEIAEIEANLKDLGVEVESME